VLAQQTAAQAWTANQAFTLAIPSGTFTDPQNEALTYTATVGTGQTLVFNKATNTFGGTATAITGPVAVKVTATDTSGLSTSETFQATISAAAPVATQTAAQTWTAGKTFSLAIPSAFADPQKETLSYKATLASGQPLPTWITFNGTTGTFSGTAPTALQSLSLSVKATDTSGLSASETIQVAISAAAPTVALQTAAQTWSAGRAFSLAIPSNAFTDPQGEKLTYTAAMSNGALPSWLAFNAATDTFSGTAQFSQTAIGSIKLTATDASGLSVSETFAASVAPAAPLLAHQTATQSWAANQAFSLALPANAFTDPQAEALRYTAATSTGALPSWLSFDSATGTFSGTAPTGVQALTLKLTATDTSGMATSETFQASVTAKAPVLAHQTAAQSWTAGKAFTLAIPANAFTDPEGETLTYTALSGGTALPSWLTFNAATETFSGTAPTALQNLSLKLTATDTSGMSSSETFQAAVSAVAPVLAVQTAAQTWTAGKAFSLAIPSGAFTDPQGEALTYTAALSAGALPTWIAFNAATGTFSGTAPTAIQAITLKVTATDTSGVASSETFQASVKASAPFITGPIVAQTWANGTAFSMTAPVFTDPQGEALTYTATSGGGALPTWLTFNAATETFSGTAPTTLQTLSLAIKATDTSGLSSSDAFQATIGVLAVTGTSTGSTLAGGNGPTTIAGLGNDTLTSGTGTTTITTGAGGSKVTLSPTTPAATVDTVTSGGGDTIWAGSGTVNIQAGGTVGDSVYAQAAKMSFINGSAPSAVFAGTGTVTIQAGAGGGTYGAGTGGGSHLTAGTGAVTFTGGATGDVLTAAGNANDTLNAGPGTETLSGGANTGTVTMTGGSGTDTMTAGAGHNIFGVGTGTTKITDGGLSSVIQVSNAIIGGTATISGFRVSLDDLHLVGFGSTEAANAVTNQTTDGHGGSLLAFSNGAHLDLVGIAHVTQAMFA